MCGLMATTAAMLIAFVICECFQPAANQVGSDQNRFGYSNPGGRASRYSLTPFYSAPCYYINYWRLFLMAHIVVTGCCRNCANNTSPFTDCRCAVSVSPLLILKLSLYSLYFTPISCSSSCGVEFGRDSKCRKLQKLQIPVTKLKRNAFGEKRLLENWELTSP